MSILSNGKGRLLIVFLFLLSFVVLFSCTKTHEEPNEVKIGAILPLTGDAASWGEAGKEGIELAVSEINSKGGINGRKLEIIYEDTQANPEKGASAMLKLATIDKVPAVVGDIVSATTLAAAPIAEKNKVVLLSPTASAPKITHAGKYIFRIWPSDLTEGTAIANFAAKDLGLKRVAILYIQNDYGIGLRDVFKKVFTQLGGKIIEAVAYKPDETNFRAHLTKIVKKSPEAIYLVSYYKDAALVLKQAKELKITTQFLGTTAVEEPKLIEIAGEAAEGLIYPISSGYDPKSQDKVVQEFNKRFKEKYGKAPGFVQAQCYDALKILAYVISKGNYTGEAIQKALEGLKDYHGVTGVISFDENGDVIKPTIIKTIKNGKFVLYQK